ncbi:hypothetical protein ACI65C_012432 [Semiaphis heraclei]
MVLMCSVRSCKTKHTKNSDIKFHKFPKNEELRSKWLLAINNESWFVPSQHSVVCSKHFDMSDYETNALGNKKLKIAAIPKSTIIRRSLLEVIVNTGVVNDFVEDGILSEVSNNSKVDLENSVVQQQHEENNISMNSSTSTKTPPQKRRKLFRYLGDYEEKDLETPRKRKMFWAVYKKTLEKKANTERLLRQKNHRLQAKIRTLNTLIDSLQADNKITANCSNILTCATTEEEKHLLMRQLAGSQHILEDEDELLTVYQNSNYIKDVVGYIAGFVVRSILKRIQCEVCAKEIKSHETNSSLLNKKNRGGLTMANADVVSICQVAERTVREYSKKSNHTSGNAEFPVSAMTGKPEEYKYETDDSNQPLQRPVPSLTDRLNKYLLCVYLNRLNEEDSHSGDQQISSDNDTTDADTEETFTD